MNIAAIYLSPHGTSETRLKLIASRAEAEGHDVSIYPLKELDADELAETDMIILASPIYHMAMLPIIPQTLKEALPPSGIPMIFLYTYGGITSGMAISQTIDFCNRNNIPLVGCIKLKAPHFWQEDDLHNQDFIQNFWNGLKEKAYKPISQETQHRMKIPANRKIRFIFPLTRILKKLRALPIHFTKECRQCNICLRNCPVNAITYKETKIVINRNDCIHCYRCVSICPFHGIYANTDKLKIFLKTNIRVMGMEKPSDSFWL